MTDRLECNNCDWKGDESEALECHDFWSRVEPGDTVPAGDCPECGAFVFPAEEPSPAKPPLDPPAIHGNHMTVAAYDAALNNENQEGGAQSPTGDDYDALHHIATTQLARAYDALYRAESFVSGFEDDETQDVFDTLQSIRSALIYAPVTLVGWTADMRHVIISDPAKIVRTAEPVNEAALILAKLVSWADEMGGFDAPAWRAAERIVNRFDSKETLAGYCGDADKPGEEG